MRYKEKTPAALERSEARSTARDRDTEDGHTILWLALVDTGHGMIPWVRVDTADVITGRSRHQWTKDNPCPRVLASVELADHAGLSRITIANIESSKGNPKLQSLQAIADALDMELRAEFAQRQQFTFSRLPIGPLTAAALDKYIPEWRETL